ncbi:transcriptional regulator PpsR [Rhodoplanes roseus]|uniref:transcriptional regulator PpsR n=1 Tax=Rhodoplanes roseus TaxID=29409 RepID=UPI003CCA743D
MGDLDVEAAATLVAAAADIALVVNVHGVIRDMACQSEDLQSALESHGPLLGQTFADTVTTESRAKVEALLRDAGDAESQRRQVNHPSNRGADVPILYSAIRLRSGPLVAVGRDLRPMAELQQRLVEAQQSMERDYTRLRHAETRYRLLFQMSPEPVLIVDTASQRVVEANPAAAQTFGEAGRRVIGRPLLEAFEADTVPAVQALLAGVRSAGRSDSTRARLVDSSRAVFVSASLFRQENASLFLVRLSQPERDGSSASEGKAKLLRFFERAPDGIVVTDRDGHVLAANPAFLDLAQLASEEQARGESLERWLGRSGVDLNVLVANLRQIGTVRLFATTLRGELGAQADVEISAAAVANGTDPCYGFTIRNVGRRLPTDMRAGREMPRSVDQLTELVGRVSLKELVREATDVVERLCIEAALELTGNNRASAAEMLGLSRQSLYVKLRRYGLADAADVGEAEE